MRLKYLVSASALAITVAGAGVVAAGDFTPPTRGFGLSIIQKLHQKHKHGNPVPSEYPAIDGTNHNLSDPTANAAGAELKRYLPHDFPDNVGDACLDATNTDRDARACVTTGGSRPRSARAISNAVFYDPAPEPTLNTRRTNNLLWQFGQFLDHDFGITIEEEPLVTINIPIPAGDPAPGIGDGTNIVIGRQESEHKPERRSVNTQTGWIDGSNVYGYGQPLAPFGNIGGTGPNTPGFIRTGVGGKLIVSAENLLPTVPTILPTPQFPANLFVCGDFFPRCNETPGLTMMHTLFVREHNRFVTELAAKQPGLSDEELFQAGRRWVASTIQSITKNEFFPELTGQRLRYQGHKPNVDGRLGMEFEHSLYRLGHTLLTRQLEQGDGKPPLGLGESLFQAGNIFQTSADLDALMRGFIGQTHEKLDCKIAEGVRSALIVDEPGTPGTLFDLGAINIDRGREIGLRSYNDTREAFGLPRVAHWIQAFDSDAAGRLQSVYASPDDLDLFPGGICERARPGAHAGPLISAVLNQQLADLMAADRFWYENTNDRAYVLAVERNTLAEVIRNNTGLAKNEVHNDAFKVR